MHPSSGQDQPALAGTFSGTVPTCTFECLRLSQDDLHENGVYGAIYWISRLLASASCTGLQFRNVALNTTLSRRLQEKNESCGLNLSFFKTCLNLPLLSGSLGKDTAAEKASIYQYLYLGYLLEKKVRIHLGYRIHFFLLFFIGISQSVNFLDPIHHLS